MASRIVIHPKIRVHYRPEADIARDRLIRRKAVIPPAARLFGRPRTRRGGSSLRKSWKLWRSSKRILPSAFHARRWRVSRLDRGYARKPAFVPGNHVPRKRTTADVR